jgi:SAM-dependent MidA family methyltransferase
MTLAEFMAECLTHPTQGYYTGRDPLGAAGDFTTAPEISQMFGELLGLWVAACWQDAGAPNPVSVVELGPGRGTLMADALRAAGSVPGFLDAARVTLVEVSPALRTKQAEVLAAYDITWQADVNALPADGPPLYVIANEFFDALPIRQFLRKGPAWAERVVTGAPDDALAFGLAPPLPVASLSHRLADTKDGDVVEQSRASEAVAEALGQRITQRGGAALVMDYGDWRSLGDTFQAMARHERADPLQDPGAADLTAHVDFEAIARAASAQGATTTQLTPQGQFLERLGINQRAQVLAQSLTGDALDAHIAAHRRLTHPDEMGVLFKVMAITPGDCSVPGLDP